jgi:hypothetical protein
MAVDGPQTRTTRSDRLQTEEAATISAVAVKLRSAPKRALKTPWDPRLKWLLRAAREVPVEDMIERHEMVETIVERHGGLYDGGETGWLDSRTGGPVRQADS